MIRFLKQRFTTYKCILSFVIVCDSCESGCSWSGTNNRAECSVCNTGFMRSQNTLSCDSKSRITSLLSVLEVRRSCSSGVGLSQTQMHYVAGADLGFLVKGRDSRDAEGVYRPRRRGCGVWGAPVGWSLGSQKKLRFLCRNNNALWCNFDKRHIRNFLAKLHHHLVIRWYA